MVRHFTNILQLRLLLGLFFLALAVPSVILVRQAYSQLKWEAFYQYRSQAQELSIRINNRLGRMINVEEARASADYSFLVLSGVPRANYRQLSPLSRFPVQSSVPGLMGYFQLDAKGHFTTPLLPQRAGQASAYGISSAQLAQRQELQQAIERILSDNHLAQPSPGRRDNHLAQPSPDRRDDQVGLMRSGSGSQYYSMAPSPSLPLELRASPEIYAKHDPRTTTLEGHTLEETVVTAVKKDGAARGIAALESRSGGKKKIAQYNSQANFERFKDGESAEKQQQKLDSLSNFGSVRVEDLNLASRLDEQESEVADLQVESRRVVRKEKSALPIVQEPTTDRLSDPNEAVPGSPAATQFEITMFESEIDPFDFALLDSGHFVIYRNVWRNGERLIQGAIIEQQQFLQGAIEPLFRETGLSQMSDLAVVFQGNVFAAVGGVSGGDYLSRDYLSRDRLMSDNVHDSDGELLYQSRMSAPFGDLELLYSINHLPVGRGATVIGWTALILAIVLLVGLLLMYRLGLRQIALARQQQDFVSSVSHELKTPLTSIRMYSEMLREGWVDSEKRRSYYDFIFEESERLSRLIANVLQLARMNREDIQIDLKPLSIDTLFDTVRSKLSSQVEAAGFTMTLSPQEQAEGAKVAVDEDCFTQILINLVDNAIKFSSKSNARSVDISARLQGTNEVVISVRDYGPGVPDNQMKKIFRLFYRSETELTRETVGTGIGLALVHQQVQAMGGKVDVINRDPGAEFSVTLKRV